MLGRSFRRHEFITVEDRAGGGDVVFARGEIVDGDRDFPQIETLAEQILQSLRSDTRVTSIELEVEKPGALSSADSVSVLAGWKRA